MISFNHRRFSKRKSNRVDFDCHTGLNDLERSKEKNIKCFCRHFDKARAIVLTCTEKKFDILVLLVAPNFTSFWTIILLKMAY